MIGIASMDDQGIVKYLLTSSCLSVLFLPPAHRLIAGGGLDENKKEDNHSRLLAGCDAADRHRLYTAKASSDNRGCFDGRKYSAMDESC